MQSFSHGGGPHSTPPHLCDAQQQDEAQRHVVMLQDARQQPGGGRHHPAEQQARPDGDAQQGVEEEG